MDSEQVTAELEWLGSCAGAIAVTPEGLDLGELMPGPTVGATRAFLAANYGVPHQDDTHYVLVAETVSGMTIGTCCDALDEAAGMLRSALREIGRAQPDVAPGSPSVIVSRDDLKACLLAAAVLPEDVLARLRAALTGKDSSDGQ